MYVLIAAAFSVAMGSRMLDLNRKDIQVYKQDPHNIAMWNIIFAIICTAIKQAASKICTHAPNNA